MQSASSVLPQSNFFQTYFIPTESLLVRGLMQKAGEYSLSNDLYYKHLASVACAVCAVAFSFFNAISYLLQIPLKIPLNIVRFDPMSLFLDPVWDLSNCLRSILFVTFGVTYVAWGILRPSTAFPFFAPPKEKSLEEINQELATQLYKAQEANAKLRNQMEEDSIKMDRILARANGNNGPVESDEEIARRLQMELDKEEEEDAAKNNGKTNGSSGPPPPPPSDGGTGAPGDSASSSIPTEGANGSSGPPLPPSSVSPDASEDAVPSSPLPSDEDADASENQTPSSVSRETNGNSIPEHPSPPPTPPDNLE